MAGSRVTACGGSINNVVDVTNYHVSDWPASTRFDLGKLTKVWHHIVVRAAEDGETMLDGEDRELKPRYERHNITVSIPGRIAGVMGS